MWGVKVSINGILKYICFVIIVEYNLIADCLLSAVANLNIKLSGTDCNRIYALSVGITTVDFNQPKSLDMQTDREKTDRHVMRI